MQTSTAQLASQEAAQAAKPQQTHEIIEEMERELFSSPNQTTPASQPSPESQPPAPNNK